MTSILLPFVFRYPFEGGFKTLNITTKDGNVPVRPLVAAMCLDWKTQYRKLVKLPYVEQLDLPVQGRYRPLGMPAGRVDEYLKTISPNRTPHPELIRYFQDLFPPALLQYLESLKPKPVRDDLKPVFDTEIPDETEVAHLLLEHSLLHIDRPLETRDYVRADYVRVGIRDFDELNYLCSDPTIQVYKPDPDNPNGKPLVLRWLFTSYQQGNMVTAAKNGYYPLPEYFRRFPHKYDKKTQIGRTIDRNDPLLPLSDYIIMPELLAPWYTHEFSTKIAQLTIIAERVENRRQRAEIQKRLDSGEGLEFLTEYDEELFDLVNECGFDDYEDEENADETNQPERIRTEQSQNPFQPQPAVLP